MDNQLELSIANNNVANRKQHKVVQGTSYVYGKLILYLFLLFC